MELPLISEVKTTVLYFSLCLDVGGGESNSDFHKVEEAKPYRGFILAEHLVDNEIPGASLQKHSKSIALPASWFLQKSSTLGSFIGALIYLEDGSILWRRLLFPKQAKFNTL